MRVSHVLFATLASMMPSALWGRSQPLGTLWHDVRGAVVVTRCVPGDHDEDCRAVEVRSGGTATVLGGGYTRVRLLWSRAAGAPGPDVVVLGDHGGSGGRADLFAVRLRPVVTVRVLGGERFDTVAVRAEAGPLRIDVPFDIEFFNGAPHAGAIVVPLPLRWDRDDFRLDLQALTRRASAARDIAGQARAIRAELAAWANERGAARRLYPPEARGGTPVTARILVDMILSGHADRAPALLDRAWPRDAVRNGTPLGGKAAFWNALCRHVVREPSWRRHGLNRLPHADIVERGARHAS